MDEVNMAVVTVRNIPDEVHRALKIRAAQHGRSTEAEIRAILESAVTPQNRIRMGDALASIGREFHLTDNDLALESDKSPATPLRFE